MALILFTPAYLLPCPSSWSSESSLAARLRPYVHHGGIVVADEKKLLYNHRGQDLFCPASTLKMGTALLALHHLGESFRFKTEFYLNEHHDLIMRGYGDPFLISEEWEAIVQGLRERRTIPRELRELRLDPSSFSPDLDIPGQGSSLNPYDAASGALVVNFNTAYVEVGKNGQIFTAEPQTPLTPLARRMARGLPAGRHRINISSDTAMALSYAGELARAFLERDGYRFSAGTGPGRVGPNDRLVYTHYNTRSLGEVIASMMLYSSNYIANQLLLAVGLAKMGEPATLEKGRHCLRTFLLNELKLEASEFVLVEGSGLSRQNRITPQALLTVLQAFYPHRHLLPQEKITGALVKTGTLKDVYSLAGYFDRERRLYFVIILNQKNNYRDKILGLIQNEFQQELPGLK